MRSHFHCAALGFILVAVPANSVAQASEEKPPAALTLNVRTVVEDIVVMDKSGRAVPDLRKGDFQVFENGKPQAITFFESNPAGSDAAALSTPPANTFTNIPLADPHGVTNVLLLDALDSWPEDQMYAQVQMVKYLASLPPHLRIGIFVLTPEKLNLIWPLNQDSSALSLAIAKFTSSHSAKSSPTADQKQALLSALDETAQNTQDSRVADGAQALQKFLKYGPGVIQQHNHEALEALHALANYLTGIPGRKNLFWIIGNFPHCEPIYSCRETMDALADAGISVYPIDARGVDTDMGLGPDSFHHQNSSRFIDSNIWAEYTGGEAYHENDIHQEIADAVNHGSRYYTLAYVPNDGKEQGRERKVEVKVSGNYTIFYRKYYLEQTHNETANAASAHATSPLLPLMGRGLPDSTGLPYRLKVSPIAMQTGTGMARAGQNAELAGKLTRYDAEFQLQAGGLSLPADANGTRREHLQVALMVYGGDFKPLNWEIRELSLSITPEQWTIDQRDGIRFHIEIDAPAGDIYLRTGVYDSVSNKVGTLEIPLTAVAQAR